MNEIEPQKESMTFDVVAPNAVEAVSRAEIDIQIATAHRYPRDLRKTRQEMESAATMDEDTAKACFYSVPRGGKTISGPSVRLAEIAASSFGNLRCGTRVISTTISGETPHVIIQSVVHDLEKNVAVTIEKRRRITSKKSYDGTRRPIDEDDINLAVNACTAIAFRDAVFKVVPLAIVKPVYDAARRTAIGDQRTLAERRDKAIETFSKMGIARDRVLGVAGKASADEITLAELETLIGLYTAIKDGTVSIDEAFPPMPPKVSKARVAADMLGEKDEIPMGSATAPVQVSTAPDAAPVTAEAPKRRGRPPKIAPASPAEAAPATPVSPEKAAPPAPAGPSLQHQLAGVLKSMAEAIPGFSPRMALDWMRAQREFSSISFDDVKSAADLSDHVCRITLSKESSLKAWVQTEIDRSAREAAKAAAAPPQPKETEPVHPILAKHRELENLVNDTGIEFRQFQQLAMDAGWLDDADAVDFSALPEPFVLQMLKNWEEVGKYLRDVASMGVTP